MNLKYLLVPMLRMGTHARKLRFLLRPQDEHQPHNSGSGKRSFRRPVPKRSLGTSGNVVEPEHSRSAELTSRLVLAAEVGVLVRTSAAQRNRPLVSEWPEPSASHQAILAAPIRFVGGTNPASTFGRIIPISARHPYSARSRSFAVASKHRSPWWNTTLEGKAVALTH